MKWMRLACISVVAAALTACGFHLRGQISLSESLTPLAIQAGDPELRQVLMDVLENSGTPVVDDPARAKAILQVRDVNYERRVRTIDSRGKVNGYLLVYSVSFRVDSAGGEELSALTPISVRRDFNFDSTQVLQKEDEERDLREEMERDMAQRILRRMSRIATIEPQTRLASAARAPATG